MEMDNLIIGILIIYINYLLFYICIIYIILNNLKLLKDDFSIIIAYSICQIKSASL